MSEIITFGLWPISNSIAKQPIEWLILRQYEDGSRLMVTRSIIERRVYVEENRAVTWSDCDLRKWLATEFLLGAFNDSERERIAHTRIETPDNPESGTVGGPATNDQVFLLSRDEAALLFPNDVARCAEATPHASAQGYCNNWWWLRSPGEFQSGPDVVLGDGRIYNCNGHYNRDLIGVRPALVLL